MEKQVLLNRINIVDKLPSEIILKILSKLDLEVLCVSARVCRSLHSWVSLTISSLSSLDLSEFSPKKDTLSNLMKNNRTIQSLTLDGTRLDDSSIYLFTKESLQELVLLRCFNFSSNIFTAIGEKCPKLRMLTLEVCMFEHHETCMKTIHHLINRCMLLESLCINFPKPKLAQDCFRNHKLFLPKLMKTFSMQSISCEHALDLFPMCYGLQSLTLVLYCITDEFLVIISQNLPNLTELCLEDNPYGNVPLNKDLSNHGILTICSCINLRRLSLTRGRLNSPLASFKRVNDVGILHLAEKLDQLEVVRLAGFRKVTDAGYASILRSCKKLRRLEIENASLLSDLAFRDLGNASRCLVDVRLISCLRLTGEMTASLSFCENLEVLDLSACWCIADLGLKSVSKLCKLIKLDLSATGITDDGLSALRVCSSPITCLSLRGCKSITESGFSMLFNGESSISKTLITLCVCYTPEMSDRVVTTISEHCKELTSLSIRGCCFVTDASIKALGLKAIAIKRLDLYDCRALSVKSCEHLRSPFFNKLRWLGLRKTMLCSKEGKDGLVDLLANRSKLSVCVSGCELYCDASLFQERSKVFAL